MSTFEKLKFIAYCQLRLISKNPKLFDSKGEASYIIRLASREDDEVINQDYEFYKAMYNGTLYNEFFGGDLNE